MNLLTEDSNPAKDPLIFRCAQTGTTPLKIQHKNPPLQSNLRSPEREEFTTIKQSVAQVIQTNTAKYDQN